MWNTDTLQIGPYKLVYAATSAEHFVELFKHGELHAVMCRPSEMEARLDALMMVQRNLALDAVALESQQEHLAAALGRPSEAIVDLTQSQIHNWLFTLATHAQDLHWPSPSRLFEVRLDPDRQTLTIHSRLKLDSVALGLK